jgi:DNA-binding transcriptional MerR regulator
MAEPVEPLMPELEEIPDKLYFRIGEVSRLTGVKQYVLRFWENEFPGLGPKKSGTGHRLFRRKDVEMVLEIKRLLYDKRFTIEGARKALENKPKPMAVPKGPRSSAKAALKAKADAAAAAGTRQDYSSPAQKVSPQPYQQQAELFPSEPLFSGLELPSAAPSRPAVDLEPVKRELRAILALLRQ